MLSFKTCVQAMSTNGLLKAASLRRGWQARAHEAVKALAHHHKHIGLMLLLRRLFTPQGWRQGAINDACDARTF